MVLFSPHLGYQRIALFKAFRTLCYPDRTPISRNHQLQICSPARNSHDFVINFPYQLAFIYKRAPDFIHMTLNILLSIILCSMLIKNTTAAFQCKLKECLWNSYAVAYFYSNVKNFGIMAEPSHWNVIIFLIILFLIFSLRTFQTQRQTFFSTEIDRHANLI